MHFSILATLKLSLSVSGPECLRFLSSLSRLCIADTIWLSNEGFELAFTLIFFDGAMKFIAPTNLYIQSCQSLNSNFFKSCLNKLLLVFEEISRSLLCTIWQIKKLLFSHWILNIARSKIIFSPEVISGNSPRLPETSRYYLGPANVDI